MSCPFCIIPKSHFRSVNPQRNTFGYFDNPVENFGGKNTLEMLCKIRINRSNDNMTKRSYFKDITRILILSNLLDMDTQYLIHLFGGF